MKKLFENGTFFTGTNYWASHAGINMWANWNPEIIESDFKKLKENNINYLRIFPLWCDFQPIREHTSAYGQLREIRMNEQPLSNTAEGIAGIDPIMSKRFEKFLALCEKYNFGVIVGLLTGWMSGRLFIPEALLKLNTITDPYAIKWEIKYVRYMVNTFKHHPCILAWDLGNECNCMGKAENSNQAYVWASTITNAIKREDSTRPVISGMHGLLPEHIWSPEDQGEILDVLCTHPYPLFTPHCATDPINEYKPALHATVQTRMYEDLGNVPAFAEEMGTLGNMVSSKKIAADYLCCALWSLWANNCKGFMWWCANEQSMLDQTPYDWENIERELGLFDADGTPKPVLKVISEFTEFLEHFEYKRLPERIEDAVCILTPEQDIWAAAYGTFALAKKVGMDIKFAYAKDDIPDASFYIIPSIYSSRAVYKNKFTKILENVHDKGATLYISIADTNIAGFAEITGLEVQTRCTPVASDTVSINGEKINIMPIIKYSLKSVGAKILATDQSSEPVMAVNDYGKGKIYTLAYPIEIYAAAQPRVLSGRYEKGYHKFYEVLKQHKNALRSSENNNPNICLTEHIIDERTRLLILINCNPRKETANISLKGYNAPEKENSKNGFEITLEGNSGTVIKIEKND